SSNGATSAAVTSNSTAATASAAELLIGATGAEARTSSETFTATGTLSNHNNLWDASADTGSSASSITIFPSYVIVAANGTYAATGTFGSSRLYECAIVTLRDAASATSTPTAT